nr:hypothetical protein [Mesomycoplasma hyorhinis]
MNFVSELFKTAKVELKETWPKEVLVKYSSTSSLNLCASKSRYFWISNL